MATTRKSTAKKSPAKKSTAKKAPAKRQSKKAATSSKGGKLARLARRKAARTAVKAAKGTKARSTSKGKARQDKKPPKKAVDLSTKSVVVSVQIWTPDNWTGMNLGAGGTPPKPNFDKTFEPPVDVCNAADFTGKKDGLHLILAPKRAQGLHRWIDRELLKLTKQADRMTACDPGAFVLTNARPKDPKIEKALRAKAEQKRL